MKSLTQNKKGQELRIFLQDDNSKKLSNTLKNNSSFFAWAA